eukprot:3164239-Rhodomonas_salina.1
MCLRTWRSATGTDDGYGATASTGSKGLAVVRRESASRVCTADKTYSEHGSHTWPDLPPVVRAPLFSLRVSQSKCSVCVRPCAAASWIIIARQALA